MSIFTFSISDYLSIRQKMRLFPNILDASFAYDLCKAFTKVTIFVQPFVDPKRYFISEYLRSLIPNNFLLVIVVVIMFFLIMFSRTIISLWIYAKLKNAVLSDNKKVVLGIAYFVIGAALLFILIPLIVIPNHTSLNAALLASIVLSFIVYAALKYLEKIKLMEKHHIFRHLVGVNRNLFSYSPKRYDFFSKYSAKIYLDMGKSFLNFFIVYLITIGLIGCFVAFVYDWGKNWFDNLEGWKQNIAYILVFLLLAIIISFGRKFMSNMTTKALYDIRRRLAHNIATLSLKDNRSNILLLRSFKDDKIMLPNERSWGHKFLALKNHFIRLEEVIADTLYPFGPLVALSNPEDKLPQIGAARENINDESWKDAIEKYMKKSFVIVFILGETESLKWEIKRAVLGGYIKKCIFIIPPDYRNSPLKLESLFNSLPEFSSYLKLKDQQNTIERFKGGFLLAGKGNDDSFILIKGPDQIGAMAYAEALRLSVLIRSNRELQATVINEIISQVIWKEQT